MSTSNTSCEKCFFANEASADRSCEFHIPEAISDQKNIKIINGYNYIANYRCKYGISKEKANEIKNYNTEIDLKRYSTEHAFVKYFLYCRIHKEDDLEHICNDIKKLQSYPGAVSLVFDHDCDVSNAQSVCNKVLGKAFPWKLHYILETKEESEIFHICTSTDERISRYPYVWIVDSQILNRGVHNDSINRINYIINVDQPSLGILISKSCIDYLIGIFITIDNINGIYKHINQNIGKGIEESYKNSIGYYD